MYHLLTKPVKGGRPSGAGRHRVAHEGHGHPLAQPLQLMDVLPVTVMQYGSGGEEGRIFTTEWTMRCRKAAVSAGRVIMVAAKRMYDRFDTVE